jgi:hypothetical protein
MINLACDFRDTENGKLREIVAFIHGKFHSVKFFEAGKTFSYIWKSVVTGPYTCIY